MTAPLNHNILGTVTAVVRADGTVDATLQAGTNLFAVPYEGFPPWVGATARFSEVSPGSWVCHSIQGDLGAFGPNLLPNGDFDTDIVGWDNTTGITVWNFDSTTESWVGSSGTLSVELDTVYNGAGALKVLATASTTVSATSPIGAAGVAVTAGSLYQGNAWVTANPNNAALRVCQIRIKWYKSGGAASTVQANSAFGTSVTLDNDAWRSIAVSATAPSDAVTAAIEIQFLSAVSGESFYVDAALLTGGNSATLTRDTSQFYSGLGSLAITSAAAGVAYGQSPSPATDPLSGIAVVEGDVHHVECRFRQSNGLTMFIVAAWVFADSSTVVDFDYSARSQPGSSAFQYYTNVYRAPTGAVAVHYAFAFIATAGSQVLYLDAVKVRQAFLYSGIALGSVNPDGFSSMVGGKQQTPALVAFVPSETDYPSMRMNGYLTCRAIHARAKTPSGSQTITAATWTTVLLSTLVEATPSTMVAAAGGTFYVIIPRNAIYKFSAQVQWDAFFGVATGGFQTIAIERWSSDGLTFLERYVAQSVYQGVTSDIMSQNCALDGRANRDERIYLKCYQNHGQSLAINAGAGAIGGAHVLSVSYIGDA